MGELVGDREMRDMRCLHFTHRVAVVYLIQTIVGYGYTTKAIR